MFALVFIGCAQAFVMALGPNTVLYNSMFNAFLSLFSILLGELELHEIRRADPYAGPLLFVTFVLLVGFVLLNMFIAILAEAYQKAKVRVFGDGFVDRDETWIDKPTFIGYIGGKLGWLVGGILGAPCILYRRLRRGQAEQVEAAEPEPEPELEREEEGSEEDLDHEGRFSPSQALMHIHRDVRAIIDGADSGDGQPRLPGLRQS
jgi:hypothetical protein